MSHIASGRYFATSLLQNSQVSCETDLLYLSSLHIKSPCFVLGEFKFPGQEVVDLHVDWFFSNDKVCTPCDTMWSDPSPSISWYNAAIHIECDSRKWEPRLYNEGPFFWVTDWSPELVIAWWRFNIYYNPPTSRQLMCVSTCATIETTRIHYKTRTRHWPLFEPVGKRRSRGTCIRIIEAFGWVFTKLNRFVVAVYRDCISQLSLDKCHSPCSPAWYRSFDRSALNLIHRQA